MSAAVSAPPIVSLPCPYVPLSRSRHPHRELTLARSYTAGGCPLFNTLDLPADSPRCAGSCAPSPAPPAPAAPSPSSAPKSPAAAATPSSTDSLFNALLLSELSSGPVDSLPLPSALLKQDSYPSYLDFGISPGQLEVPPPATYLPQPGTSSSTVQLPPRNGAAGGEKHQLWDIEELVPLDGRKKTRTTPPPPARSTSAAQTIAYAGQADLSVLPPLPQPPQAASPTPSDEETEVVTVRPCASLSHALTDPSRCAALHLEIIIPPLARRIRALDPLGLDGPIHPHRAHETAPPFHLGKVL